MLSSTHKKVKTTDTSHSCSTPAGNGDEDFDKVKKYLLNCPLVSSDHPAIRAAVAAIDKEQQRMERDRKLQQKFAQGKSSTVVSASTTLEDGVVVVERGPMSPSSSPSPFSQPSSSVQPDSDDVDEMMEWQDVQEKEKDAWDDDDDLNTSGSFLGKNLAKLSIDSIAEQNIKLHAPLAAIAVAFHASLRSDLLDFCCTGVPEDPSTLKGGFAPPVRELPKTQFLPRAWDEKPRRIALRYRNAATGAMILTVELGVGGVDGVNGGGTDSMVTVRWQPANSKEEPSSQTLSFLLSDHINLDSWNAALKTTSSVSPALHYKSLALLLSNFCRTFDLGAIYEGRMEESTHASIPANGPTTTTTTLPLIQKSDLVPPVSTTVPPVIPPVGMSDRPNFKYEVPTTFYEAFPGLHRPLGPHGDFAGDLLPSGLLDPRVPHDGRMGGNLMGPNHPMFQGRDGDHFGIPIGGPGTMQPRFDPIYPDVVDFPHGPPSNTIGRRSNRPSRSGEPNPDHLPPPNSFGNNMFL